jgi:hypothetical protein
VRRGIGGLSADLLTIWARFDHLDYTIDVALAPSFAVTVECGGAERREIGLEVS